MRLSKKPKRKMTKLMEKQLKEHYSGEEEHPLCLTCEVIANKKLIAEFVPILEMGINTANRLLSHAKKSRKGELHNSIEDLIKENMMSMKSSLEYYKKEYQKRIKRA